MLTKTIVLASLAVVLVGAGALVGGTGVHAEDAGQMQARSCVDASEPATCASPLPSIGQTPTTPDGPTPASAMPGPIASGEYDACFLVLDSEMEALFHRQLAMQPSGTRAGGVHDCVWSFDPQPWDTAVIWLGAYNGWADLAGLSPEAVPGLGDEALWVLGGLLYVRKGDTAFTVMVISDTLDARETAASIARSALPRIR